MTMPPSPANRRKQFLAALLVNAASKPFNIVMLLVVAAAGMLVGAPVVLAVAVAAAFYFAGTARTLLDGAEQDKVLARIRGERGKLAAARRARVSTEELAAPVRRYLDQAIVTQRRIADAIERAQLPYEALAGEVDAFVTMMHQSAERAQLLVRRARGEPAARIQQRLDELAGSDTLPSSSRCSSSCWSCRRWSGNCNVNTT